MKLPYDVRHSDTTPDTVTTLASDDDDRNDVDPEPLARAICVCRDEKQRSISLLQRRLRLGYTVASVLLDSIAEHVGENWTPHRWSRGTLAAMNEAWADGHVQRVDGHDVKARYKGNFFNWR